ncbi:hypothetical protein B9Y64_02290 [Stenotrophomonas maltophilia]|uniref:Uncharacterized protein n=1 Tax=Stenotrophomonas maltophilia TaxID=40324 RepID=A0A2J0UGG9_STEMA|nr:hypothetical protein B9Y64_02290 [Stenotrophomonas maltophilia]
MIVWIGLLCVHNPSDPYLTDLVLIEALIFMDGGLFRLAESGRIQPSTYGKVLMDDLRYT